MSVDHPSDHASIVDHGRLSSLRLGVAALVLAGLMFILHGIGFIYRTYATDGFELGVDSLDGHSASELATTHPEVVSYIDHLQVSFGGLLGAVGIAIIAFAYFGVRHYRRWALGAAVLVPAVFGAISIPIHQTVHFEFDALLHLGPAAVGLPVLVVGAILAYRGLDAE